MGTLDRINEDFKRAMKEGDKVRVKTLKLIRSELQNEEINSGEELATADVRKVLSSQAKQRREAIEKYREGGRDDLVASEKEQLEIIEEYLPESLSDSELEDLVESVIEETGAEDMGDMGAIMGTIMPKIRGRADGDEVRGLVREKLS